MDNKLDHKVLDAIIGLINTAIDNNTKPLKAKIKFLEKKLEIMLTDNYIETLLNKIKQLEAELKDHKKTISNQTESYAKALNYNNDLEQENTRLKEALKKVVQSLEFHLNQFNQEQINNCQEKFSLSWIYGLSAILQKALEE